jgi:hypothetical protein
LNLGTGYPDAEHLKVTLPPTVAVVSSILLVNSGGEFSSLAVSTTSSTAKTKKHHKEYCQYSIHRINTDVFQDL